MLTAYPRGYSTGLGPPNTDISTKIPLYSLTRILLFLLRIHSHNPRLERNVKSIIHLLHRHKSHHHYIRPKRDLGMDERRMAGRDLTRLKRKAM
jgi:hypothetical protein